MIAFVFVNPDWAISEIDGIIESLVDYRKAINNTLYLSAGNVTIPVWSINDIIDNEKAKRP